MGINPWKRVKSACAIDPNGLTCHATKKKRRNVFTAEGRESDAVLEECVLLLSIFSLQKNNLRGLIRRLWKKSIKIIGMHCALEKNWHQMSFQNSSGADCVTGFIVLSLLCRFWTCVTKSVLSKHASEGILFASKPYYSPSSEMCNIPRSSVAL